MARHSADREKRHQLLQEKLRQEPFMTDGDLAVFLGVSISTVRLDRLALGIPELRERVMSGAETSIDTSDAIIDGGLDGEILDVEVGVRGISVMAAAKEMCFERMEMIRGQYIYAMAERLAIAIADLPAALIGVANIKYKTPVKVGAKLVARGEVKAARKNSIVVWVRIYCERVEVFRGKYILNGEAGV